MKKFVSFKQRSSDHSKPSLFDFPSTCTNFTTAYPASFIQRHEQDEVVLSKRRCVVSDEQLSSSFFHEEAPVVPNNQSISTFSQSNSSQKGNDDDLLEVYSILDSGDSVSELQSASGDESDIEFLPDISHKKHEHHQYYNILLHSDDESHQHYYNNDRHETSVGIDNSEFTILNSSTRVKEIQPRFPQITKHFWTVQQISKFGCCSVDFNLFTLDGGISNPNCPPSKSTQISRILNANDDVESAYEKRRRARDAKHQQSLRRREAKRQQVLESDVEVKRDRLRKKRREQRERIFAKRYEHVQKRLVSNAGYVLKKEK